MGAFCYLPLSIGPGKPYCCTFCSHKRVWLDLQSARHLRLLFNVRFVNCFFYFIFINVCLNFHVHVNSEYIILSEIKYILKIVDLKDVYHYWCKFIGRYSAAGFSNGTNLFFLLCLWCFDKSVQMFWLYRVEGIVCFWG